VSLDSASKPAETWKTRIGERVRTSWTAIERFLACAGDWLNPILVKETRQSLKSLQFTATFVLLLIACWIVTIGGIAIVGPRIALAAEGGRLLLPYYSILAFPLAVVVPYAAFRSLTSEREDNTYDLLSITTLRPRQIISGKLGSAVVQMSVYFSAITPCLAFTYLLRGVDLPTIAVSLAYLFFSSLGLSMIGILLATLSKRRFSHVFLSVAFLGGLLWHFAIPVMTKSVPMLQASYVFLSSAYFWVNVAFVATFYVTFFALAYFTSAAMISFTSENRSSPLRLCMLVQMVAFVGWAAYFWFGDRDSRPLRMASTVAFTYWYVMGTLLTAERSVMSQRVKRRLPQSFLGRMFFSWLNPGPASGYMFVIANTTSVALICYLALLYTNFPATSSGATSFRTMICVLVVAWSYLVAYLGIGLLAIRLIRRVAVVTTLACVLIHFLLLLGGFGIPFVLKSMSLELRNLEYTFLQITDPIFTLRHVEDGTATADIRKILMIIPSVAICILLANLPGVIRELRVVRETAPNRVLEDEAELHPAPASVPASPWDEAAT
jgi:hypothetical protein